MPLPTGTWLGPYQVLAPLGAGGMGDVFRGRDSRLGRDVAIKVLTDGTSNDPKALARFAAEARAIASLSHPNILAIHDVGESNGIRYAITELLEGQTLRAALRNGALTQRRALDIARQIAAGLAAAHDSGLVHRDIKPENVFIDRDGHVKVLDFGLARHEPRPRDQDDTRSPTVSALTGENVIVGTVAYMSPEQARALPVDYRSDQFSLGVVLYEMLSGIRPFRRESVAETLAAIIRDEHESLSRRTPGVGAPVRFLVDRLLSKDPAGRFESTHDLVRELETWRRHSSEASGPVHIAPIQRTARGRFMRSVASATLGIGLGAAFATWQQGSQAAPGVIEPIVRSAIDIRPASSLVPPTPLFAFFPRTYRTAMALSPDGRFLAFSAMRDGSSQLFLRRLDQDEAVPVQGPETPPAGILFGRAPFFSPDGNSLGFIAKGTIWRVPLAGGPPVPLVEGEAFPPYGAAFAEDGSLYFGRYNAPIFRLAASGAKPEPVTQLEKTSEVSHRFPFPLPGERGLIFTTVDDELDSSKWKVVAQRVPQGERHVLVEGASDGRYVPTGHLVYARRGALFAAPFDPERLAITGPEMGVLSEVMHAINVNGTNLNSGAAQFAFSRSGTLAYLPGGVEPQARTLPAWIDRSGRVAPMEGLPPAICYGGRFSPDGTRQLFTVIAGGARTVGVFDSRRGTLVTVPVPAGCGSPLWTPDGDHIVCTVASGGTAPTTRLHEVSVASGAPRSVLDLDGDFETACYTPDGKSLVLYRNEDSRGPAGLWLFSPGVSKDPLPLGAGPGAQRGGNPVLSPDGKLIAYVSLSSAVAPSFEVYVQTLSHGRDREQASTMGGDIPAWAPDGRELYFVRRPSGGTAPRLYAVAISPGPPLVLGRERAVCELPEETLFTGAVGGNPTVSSDGKRFLFILREKTAASAPITEIRLVQNWFTELKARTAATVR